MIKKLKNKETILECDTILLEFFFAELNKKRGLGVLQDFLKKNITAIGFIHVRY